MRWILFLPLFLVAIQKPVERVHAHLLIEDPAAAVQEAEIALQKDRDNKELQFAYALALAAAGDEKGALTAYTLQPTPELLEEIAWGIIQKGVKSSQYTIRIASLIGSYLTHDVRATNIMKRFLNDSNAILRMAALQFASDYPDDLLQEEIERLAAHEKVYQVRVQSLSTIGKMGMKRMLPYLEKVVSSDKSTLEEKTLAMRAIVHMYDNITPDRIKLLATGNRAGLRGLAAESIAYFDLKEVKGELFSLAIDPISDVRMAAVHAIPLVFDDYRTVKPILMKAVKDIDPMVAITAAWAMIHFDPDAGQYELNRWFYDERKIHRLLAAAALAKTGKKGAPLALKILKDCNDPYVKVNVSLGLLGMRVETKLCCDILYDFLIKEKTRCLWSTSAPYFQMLVSSTSASNEEILQMPEALDRMARLQLFSFLAILGDERALPALRELLQEKRWGISGYAAVTLLKEGEEDALELVRKLLTDPDTEVRLQAAFILAMLGRDDSVVGILEEAYMGADHIKKLQILEALGHIGNSDSISFLVRAMHEPFEILRIVASSSAIQCLNR